jgi:hypothetical protein
MAASFIDYLRLPSAVISDGIVNVPLYAVSTIVLTEAYHLPPVGSSTARAVVSTHDDTVTISGVLVGPERFTWKLLLEDMAEASKRGGFIATKSKGRSTGLVLITSMTIRTDMQIQNLTFTASAAKREVLDVSVVMMHMPLPGTLGKLLDVAALGVAALADWKGR